MLEFLETIGVATLMFAATNADDLVLLTIFFTQPNRSVAQIVAGQLTGIAALTALSLLAATLALAVPHGWITWLGLIPLAIGLHWLRRPAHADRDEPPAAASWWAIASITIANGADNLGVYIPQFAIQPTTAKITTVAVFLVLTLLWCWIALLTTRHPRLSPLLSAFCRRSAPWVLIGLGAWIVAQHPFFGLA